MALAGLFLKDTSEVIKMFDQIEYQCFTVEEIRRELLSAPTRMLVALHNVNSFPTLKVDSDGHGARCLAIADEILVSRGVPAEAGKMLKQVDPKNWCGLPEDAPWDVDLNGGTI